MMILAAGIAISFPSPATAQTSSEAHGSDRLAAIDRRIKEIGDEIKRLQNILRDGKAISSHYEVVTRNLKEFYQQAQVHSRNCALRQLEYERLKREGNPFADRDLLPAVQRCRADQGLLEADGASFARTVEMIGKDVDFIVSAARATESNINMNEDDLRVQQSTRNLIRNIKQLGDGVDRFRYGYRM